MLLGSLSSQLVCDVGYNYPHLQTKIPRLETASQPSQQYQGWEASLGTAAPRRAHQAPRYPDHPERLIPLYPIPCLLDHWPFSPYCPTLPWGSDSPTSQSLSEGWRKLRGNLLLRAMDGAGASTSPSKGAGAPTTDNRWEEEPKIDSRDVPGGSAAETLPCEAGDVGLIPGQRTKIPHALGQLSLCATTKTLCSQISKYLKNKVDSRPSHEALCDCVCARTHTLSRAHIPPLENLETPRQRQMGKTTETQKHTEAHK